MRLTKKWKQKASPVDAVYLTEKNYREVAEWCGGRVATEVDRYLFLSNHDAPCIAVLTINTAVETFSMRDVFAVAGKHVVLKNSRGFFEVLTVEQFEEWWEPTSFWARLWATK